MRSIGHRLAVYLFTLLAIMSLHFALIHAMPGDPLIHILGEDGYAAASQAPELLDKLRHQYGLNGSVGRRLIQFWGRVLQGDWGYSLSYGQPVFSVIMQRLPQTLWLLTPAVMISAILAAVLGAWAGFYHGRAPEQLLTRTLMALYAMPGFCLAMLLVALLAATTGSIPRGGLDIRFAEGFRTGLSEALRNLFLPVMILSIGATAAKYLVMKNAMRQILNTDFVLTAIAKGLSGWRLLVWHVLPNAWPPLINMVALHAGRLVSGALLVEIVFSWPGMGGLLQEAALSRDYPLLMGCFAVLTVCVLLANALADVACIWADPRVADGVAAR